MQTYADCCRCCWFFLLFSLFFSVWAGWSKVDANLCRLLSGEAEKLWIVPRPHSSFSDRSKIIDIWVIRSGLTTELAWWKWRQWQCKAKILPGPTKKRPGLVLVPATFGDSDVWHWTLWWLNFWGMRHVTLGIMATKLLGSFDSCTYVMAIWYLDTLSTWTDAGKSITEIVECWEIFLPFVNQWEIRSDSKFQIF